MWLELAAMPPPTTTFRWAGRSVALFERLGGVELGVRVAVREGTGQRPSALVVRPAGHREAVLGRRLAVVDRAVLEAGVDAVAGVLAHPPEEVLQPLAGRRRAHLPHRIRHQLALEPRLERPL